MCVDDRFVLIFFLLIFSSSNGESMMLEGIFLVFNQGVDNYWWII